MIAGRGQGRGSALAIRTGSLRGLPRVHVPPIEQVVSLRPRRHLILGRASHLDAVSAYPFRTWSPSGAPGGTAGTPAVRPSRSLRTGRAARPRPVPNTAGPDQPAPWDVGTASRKCRTPATDSDRSDSRRSTPSSRAALMGEQPNPWDLLQPQDAASRHRGTKPRRRWGLSGGIGPSSPGSFYPLLPRPSHAEPRSH